LLQGDFEGGWPEYEWRWKTGQLRERCFAQPRWNGEPLAGKLILLHAEQGLGDTIQFVRYAAIVKSLGATVVVECQRALVKLLGSCAGIDRLVGAGDDLPSFDFHAPLLSLPGIFRTDLASIPAPVPYLRAAQDLVEQWRVKLMKVDGFRVAMNWRGEAGKPDSMRRAIPLPLFATLSELSGLRLISVQKDVQDRETKTLDSRSIVNPGPEIDTAHGAFMDTAAIMRNVDLVITSDTSVAHLAGALGVPVWVALPFVPDWRWLLDRSDSPWYPTMRLFRQNKRGDWKSVFEEIREALSDRIRSIRRSTGPLS